MMPIARTPLGRRAWLGVAVATIAIGLVVHEAGFGLPPAARDVTGDALWAVMIFAWVGAAWPRGAWHLRALVALLGCWAVELSQAYHTPRLDALRETTLGQLTLGSGFDPRDLGAYAIGVLFAAAVERWYRARHPLR